LARIAPSHAELQTWKARRFAFGRAAGSQVGMVRSVNFAAEAVNILSLSSESRQEELGATEKMLRGIDLRRLDLIKVIIPF
jgi:hypothetical protein